jgi:hypothetical protein
MRNTGRKACLRSTLCILISFAALNTPVLAETGTGRIAGVLKDPSGAVVPGGQINIRNLDSGVARSTTTDRQGRYVFEAVPVGRYEAAAVSPGFETAVRTCIAVTAGPETTIGVELSIARFRDYRSLEGQDQRYGIPAQWRPGDGHLQQRRRFEFAGDSPSPGQQLRRDRVGPVRAGFDQHL